MTDEHDQPRTIAEKLWSQEGVGPAFGIEILEAGVGYSKLKMKIRHDMLNGFNTAHGGIIFTLADTAFAYACNSHNVLSVALNASITFLSPVQPDEELVAEAREDASAGRTGVYSVVLLGGDGRRVAIFNGVSRSTGSAILENK